MEQTIIELSRIKLLHERNGIEKQELESKTIVAQHEMQDLQHHIHVIEVEIKKTLHTKEKKLNQLQMELIMIKKRKVTLEQQMQLYGTIKRERDLLKANWDRKDAKYWALKKKQTIQKLDYNFTTKQGKSPMIGGSK